VHVPSATFFDVGVFSTVLGSTLLILVALAHQSIRSRRQLAQDAEAAPRRRPHDGVVIAVAIGLLGGAGVWLVLRPRTFQVIMGLALLAYAVNLFIFSMGSLSVAKSRSSSRACRRIFCTTPTRCRRRSC
jgi:hypothetical protein